MPEPGPEPEPGEVVVGQAGDELALLLGRVELKPGGQQELPSGQPWRRIDQLRDVHPPDRQVQPPLAGDQANLEILQQLADGQHVASGPLGSGSRRRMQVMRSRGVHVHPVGGLGEDVAQDALDLLELLRAGDQRR